MAVTVPCTHKASTPVLHEVLRTHSARAGRAVHRGHAACPLRRAFIADFDFCQAEIADVVAGLASRTHACFLQDRNHGDPRPTATVRQP